MKRIKEEYNYFSSFFVSEKTANYYYYDGILKVISTTDPHDVWYYDFVKKNIPFDLDVDKDEASAGTITAFINHRLEDIDGNLLGVTGIGLKMESIGQTLRDYQEKYGHLIYMVDSTGLVQVHTDINVIEKLNIRDMPGVGSLTEKILSSKQGTSIYEYKDTKLDLIISSRYFPGPGLVLDRRGRPKIFLADGSQLPDREYHHRDYRKFLRYPACCPDSEFIPLKDRSNGDYR